MPTRAASSDIQTLTLALDAATYAGSVALIRGVTVVAERTVAMRGEREERLMPAVAEALEEAATSVAAVDRVVCGAGPGSFTSLRIAAAIAKGVAQGGGAPLLAVSSLTLVVAGAPALPPPGRYLARLDAMRGEWYAALLELDSHGAVREVEPARLLDDAALAALAHAQGAAVVGPGRGSGARSETELAPHARGVARLLAHAPGALVSVDLAGWEPRYGRLAEAQVQWEAAHGRALSLGG